MLRTFRRRHRAIPSPWPRVPDTGHAVGRRNREFLGASWSEGQVVAFGGENEGCFVCAIQLISRPLPVADLLTGGGEPESGVVEIDCNLDLAVTEIDNPKMFGQIAPQQ